LSSASLGLGCTAGLIGGFVAALNAGSATVMATWFILPIAAGLIGGWAIGNILTARLVVTPSGARRSLTSKDQASVFLLSLVVVAITFQSHYGLIIAPIVVLVFNGAVWWQRRLDASD
jgi:hypothetical protein